MADLITVDQYEARIGRDLDPSEARQVKALIADASAIVRRIARSDLDPVPDAIVPIVVAMVRRGAEFPHGFTGESNEGYAYSGAPGTGIFPTPREIEEIREAAGAGRVAALDLEGYLPRTPRLVAEWMVGE